MKAILTTYFPPTNFRGSRVKAKAEGVPALVLGWAAELEPYDNHKAAALALCKKYDWGQNIEGGGLPNQRGYAFVFTPEAKPAPVAGMSEREIENTKQAVWKLRGISATELEGKRLGVRVALHNKLSGYDAILATDAEAEAFRDGLRVARLGA